MYVWYGMYAGTALFLALSLAHYENVTLNNFGLVLVRRLTLNSKKRIGRCSRKDLQSYYGKEALKTECGDRN